MPLYLKEYYKDEPLFANTKVVTSIYENEIEGKLNSEIVNKIKFDKVENETMKILEDSSYENLYKISIMNSDGVIFASDKVKDSYLDIARSLKIPTLNCGFQEGFEKEYIEFYNNKILK
jgi:starch synthase